MDIHKVAEKYGEYQVNMRRYFHQNPELSWKEYNTSKVVKEELDKIGVPWRSCGGETGVLATIQGRKPGKTILIRGDMDALEVEEKTGLPYASQHNGVMHACGHDCHISMMLTAAHILQDMRDDLCGTVKLAFQPAEEMVEGAVAMIKEGALDGVDGCFAIHVWSDIESGRVFCAAGPEMASSDHFIIDVLGKGGHGSAPHQCVDAAVASSAIISNLQTIVSRELPPLSPAVVTVGTVEIGNRWNCIPETAHIEGTCRAFTRDIRDSFAERIERIASTTASAFRASAKSEYIKLVGPTVNDAGMAAIVQNASRKVVSPDAPISMPPVTGGEDFAYFIERVPGAVALLGVRSEACGSTWPQHSNRYCVDESMLIRGAMLYAQVAMDFNAGGAAVE